MTTNREKPHAIRRIAFLSFGGGNASAITGPLEVFQFAHEHTGPGPGIELTVLTKDGGAVTCGECVTVTPTGSLDAVTDPDLIFLAGMPCDVDACLSGNEDAVAWVAERHQSGAEIATVCPAQVLLAAGGLLDGKRVAMHWSLIDDVRARWPAVHWNADRVVVADRGIYSCCGAGAATDLTMYLVDRICGRDVMLECAQWFLTDLPRVRQDLPPPLFNARSADDTKMAPVEAWILGHFHEPIHFEDLAREFGMSWRTFYRRFNDTFGVSPKLYLQKLRLNAARRLLEADAGSIDKVAATVGYTDSAFFRQLFKRHIGMTPSRYRESFRFRSIA